RLRAQPCRGARESRYGRAGREYIRVGRRLRPRPRDTVRDQVGSMTPRIEPDMPPSQKHPVVPDALKRQRARQEAFRAQVADVKGSSADYLAKLALSDITSGDD